MQQDHAGASLDESISLAKQNLAELSRVTGGKAKADQLLKIAELQVEMAKVAALVMITQALSGIGQSTGDLGVHLRTGLEVVAEAVDPGDDNPAKDL